MHFYIHQNASVLSYNVTWPRKICCHWLNPTAENRGSFNKFVQIATMEEDLSLPWYYSSVLKL
jgi:hypothetical protein